MLSKVGIICFAASYGVALVLEITRLLFRSGIRGAVMVAFTAAGLVAHTAFLFYQGVAFHQGSPFSSDQHWFLAVAWVLAAVYLFLTVKYPRVQFGLFILPLVLGLIVVASRLAEPSAGGDRPDYGIWGIIHGGSILAATAALMVGFASGLMYLGQARRLKNKVPPQKGLRLPSLEWLQKANSHALALALAMVAIAIVSGTILNLMIRRDPAEGFVPWTDPVILSTLGMFAWLLAAVAVSVLYKPAREGRKVAWLTLASFVFLMIALAMLLLVDTRHGDPRKVQDTEIGLREGSRHTPCAVRGSAIDLADGIRSRPAAFADLAAPRQGAPR